jgi:deoxycytidylate deaminase|tara:strand:+ start:90 stop:425 length:336 start_codon:yes stop_codon:yes gene_type:complete
LQNRAEFNLTATLYDKRGRILSIGTNSYTKTHPLQSKFATEAGKPGAVFLHAEIDALRKCKDWKLIRKIKIERYDSKGNPKLAKPCKVCKHAIEQVGISKVEFTNEKGKGR